MTFHTRLHDRDYHDKLTQVLTLLSRTCTEVEAAEHRNGADRQRATQLERARRTNQGEP